MKKVVVIGGGTGNFTVLSGLKKYNIDLSAIVSMADDGGSTGILRDELGVLPPGDVRQCLVALSDSSRLMRSLMNYRFEKAVEEVGKILSIKGKVIPVTTHQVRLNMILANGKVLQGEKEVHLSTEIYKGYKSIYLEPFPQANPHAINEIMNADLVVFGPGGLYTSLITNLLVEGVGKALRETKAKKVFIVNLMNKKGQTPKFTVKDHLNELKKYVGKDVFDYIIVNNSEPPKELIEDYAEEGEMVKNDLKNDTRIIETSLFSNELKEVQKGDTLKRNLIRHDSQKLANELMKIVDSF